MLARYYSQGYGRFLSPDPGYDYDQLDPMSWNLYSYVRGNPVKNVDPTGFNSFGAMELQVTKYDATFYKDKESEAHLYKIKKDVFKKGMIVGAVIYGSLIGAYGGQAFIQSTYGRWVITQVADLYFFMEGKVKNAWPGFKSSAPYILAGDFISGRNLKTMGKNQGILFVSNMIVPGSALTYSLLNTGLAFISNVLKNKNASIELIKSATDTLNTLMILSDELPPQIRAILTVAQQALENKMEDAMKRERARKRELEEENKKKQYY